MTIEPLAFYRTYVDHRLTGCGMRTVFVHRIANGRVHYRDCATLRPGVMAQADWHKLMAAHNGHIVRRPICLAKTVARRLHLMSMKRSAAIREMLSPAAGRVRS